MNRTATCGRAENRTFANQIPTDRHTLHKRQTSIKCGMSLAFAGAYGSLVQSSAGSGMEYLSPFVLTLRIPSRQTGKRGTPNITATLQMPFESLDRRKLQCRKMEPVPKSPVALPFQSIPPMNHKKRDTLSRYGLYIHTVPPFPLPSLITHASRCSAGLVTTDQQQQHHTHPSLHDRALSSA